MRRQLYVLQAVILAIAAGLISFRSMYEPDLWWHLAQGREVAAGRLVRTNLFSFAYPDYPQAYTSWLFDLGSYLLWTRLGAAGIQAAQAAVLAATLAVIGAACRVRASAAAAAAVCLFGWIVLEPRAIPRPHLLSFLGVAICMWMIERARAARSWRPLRWAPALVAVWSNLHVECVFGVAIVGLFAAGEWLWPRDLSRRAAAAGLAVAALALAATMANPYGAGLLRYLVLNTSVPQVLKIAELQPPYLPNYRGFFAWIVLSAAMLAWRWRRITLGDAAIIALFAAMGLRYLRLTPLVLLVSAPLVARCLDDLEAFRVSRRSVVLTALVTVLIISRVPIGGLVRGVRIGGDALTPPALFSEPAMQFARAHGLSGPAFTSMNLGGYVAWELFPAARVSMDSRLQAYPPEYFRAVMRASGEPAAWAAVTAAVDWGVISVPRNNELSGVGKFDPAAWGVAYRDAAIDIVVRRDGRFGTLARPF